MGRGICGFKKFWKVAMNRSLIGWNPIITTPTLHIPVILKITKIAITHLRKTLEVLNFTVKIVREGFIGIGVKAEQWPCHHPLLDEILYLYTWKYYTNFNRITNITVSTLLCYGVKMTEIGQWSPPLPTEHNFKFNLILTVYSI